MPTTTALCCYMSRELLGWNTLCCSLTEVPFQKQCQALYSLCHCAALGMILLEMSCPSTMQCELLQNSDEAPQRKHLWLDGGVKGRACHGCQHWAHISYPQKLNRWVSLGHPDCHVEKQVCPLNCVFQTCKYKYSDPLSKMGVWGSNQIMPGETQTFLQEK